MVHFQILLLPFQNGILIVTSFSELPVLFGVWLDLSLLFLLYAMYGSWGSCCMWFLGLVLQQNFVLFAPCALIVFPHLCLAKLKFHLKLFAALIVYGDREIQLLWSPQCLSHSLHVFGNRHTNTYRREVQQGTLLFGCMITHSFSFMLFTTSKALANPPSIEIYIDQKLL